MQNAKDDRVAARLLSATFDGYAMLQNLSARSGSGNEAQVTVLKAVAAMIPITAKTTRNRKSRTLEMSSAPAAIPASRKWNAAALSWHRSLAGFVAR
jgi:hypothetical protein